MPIYEYQCCKCSAEGTYFRTVADRLKTPKCAECGGKTRQIISAVRGFADLPEYISPATGKLIRGRRMRRDDLERSDCRPYEGTEVEMREAKRIRAERAKKLDAQMDDVLRTTIAEAEASNLLTRTSDRSDPLPDFTGMRTY